MQAVERQTFAMDPRFVKLFRASIWILAGFVVFFIALPFIPDDKPPANPAGMMGLSLFGIAFFGGLAWYGIRIAKQLPYSAVSVDPDGLWPAHVPKENGLVPWQSIAAVAERPFLQRLDGKNARGEVVLKVEYQLRGFEQLRALIAAALPSGGPALRLPATFSKSIRYHIFYIAGLAGFTLLGLSVSADNPWLGYAGMGLVVALAGHEYLTTVCAIEVGSARIKVRYPLKQREFAYADIESVQMDDVFVKGSRHPEVVVFLTRERKPIKLNRLGASTAALSQIIADLKARHGQSR